MQGLTSIASLMFVKEFLDLSAEFMASLFFWLTLPWALKMPVGNVVDVFWNYRRWFLVLGIGLVTLSNLLMVLLLLYPDQFGGRNQVSMWFALCAALPPIGFVLQDVVADALTVETASRKETRSKGSPGDRFHTEIQTLGRVFFLFGTVLTWLINIVFLRDVADFSLAERGRIFALIHVVGLLGPGVALGGVVAHFYFEKSRKASMGRDSARSCSSFSSFDNWVVGGGLAYVVIILVIKAVAGNAAEAFVFSLTFVATSLLFGHMVKRAQLTRDEVRSAIGTAIILWSFMAMPEVGIGLQWWQIDRLGFDAQFLAVLRLTGQLASILVLALVVPRFLLSSINLVALMSWLIFLRALFFLPDLALYYGLQESLSELSLGILGPRSLALIDNASEGPLNQIAAIPILVWAAKHAPIALKATYFAVASSLMNCSSQFKMLVTKHINQMFVVNREVLDTSSGMVMLPEDYDQLGSILLIVLALNTFIPLIVLMLVSRYLLANKLDSSRRLSN